MIFEMVILESRAHLSFFMGFDLYDKDIKHPVLNKPHTDSEYKIKFESVSINCPESSCFS